VTVDESTDENLLSARHDLRESESALSAVPVKSVTNLTRMSTMSHVDGQLARAACVAVGRPSVGV